MRSSTVHKTVMQNALLQGVTKHRQRQNISGACKVLLRTFFSAYNGPVTIQLWDQEIVIGNDQSKCTIIFRKQYPLRGLFIHKDLTCLVDAYLCGDIDIRGNLELLFNLVNYLQNNKFSMRNQIRSLLLAARIPNDQTNSVRFNLNSGKNKSRNNKESIAYHYDVSNDFYRLFLDPEMVYSCAYFSDSTQSLINAQRDKLDYICRKLRLRPGLKVLDIGCGWGGLAIWAAQHYGVQVHGITLSHEQYAYAVARINKLNLNEKIRIELLDYRELSDETTYDRIVSVGMFEHVGIQNYPVYFGLIKSLLKPDGLFLNHGITNDTGWLRTPGTQFINTYIFPDGELARLSDVITSMEDTGFEIIDTETLRPHYALTLRRWLEALEKNKDEAIQFAGESTYRLWRLYMAGSAWYFSEGSININQVLTSINRQPWTLPLRRDDLCLNKNNSSLISTGV